MNTIVKKIGIELEMPLTKQNYLAADFEDARKLFLDFSEQGWSQKKDPHTKALIAVERKTKNGIESLNNDLGVCVLEAALAPVQSLDEAINYWQNFKHFLLLPTIQRNNLKLLGYGTHPLANDLKALIAQKGHYLIWKNMISEDCRKWIFQNSPGMCAAQFNFEIPKKKALQILNTFLQLLAFLWAASTNDSIASGQKLPYKSHRFYAYSISATGRMSGRFGMPDRVYTSLCDYINKTWEVPIFEIVRDGFCFYPKDLLLTTHQFINEGKAEFYSLECQSYKYEVTLDDLLMAIYCSWTDFRLKFNFYQGTKKEDLINAVCNNNDSKLLDLVEYIVIEIRPIAMQSKGEEINWLILTYLLLENVDSINEYVQAWTYQDVKKAAINAQKNGLKQELNGKTLGEIGLDLLKIINDNVYLSRYEPYLSQIQDRFINNCSPGDDVIRIFKNNGIDTLLDYLTIRI